MKFQCHRKMPVGESRLDSRDKNVTVTDAETTNANNFGAHRNAASYDMSALQRRRPDAALHSTQLPAFHFRQAHLPPRQSQTRSGGSEHSPFLFLVPRLSLRDMLLSLRSAVRVPDLLPSICLASSLPCLYSSLFALGCMHTFFRGERKPSCLWTHLSLVWCLCRRRSGLSALNTLAQSRVFARHHLFQSSFMPAAVPTRFLVLNAFDGL